jgi:orotate phosphoribosyltransferase
MDTSIPSFLPDGVVFGVASAAVPAIAILALLLALLARPRLPLPYSSVKARLRRHTMERQRWPDVKLYAGAVGTG